MNKHLDDDLLDGTGIPETAETNTAKKTAAEKHPETLGHAEVAELMKQLNDMEAKANEHWNSLLRTQAEFNNYQQRAEREKADYRKYATKDLMGQLLPVIDNLERSLEVNNMADPALQNIYTGVQLTLKIFLDTLKKAGLEVVNPANSAFDPNLHEAMSMQEHAEIPSGQVISVLQKGYTLHGRLLRPALVTVAK